MILALMVAAAAGCGSEEKQGGLGGDIEGTFWVLTSYLVDGQMKDAPADYPMDAEFQRGMVSGSSGVNTYGGSYTLSGSSLSVGNLASTMMAGPDEAMQAESAYLKNLEASSSYTAAGDVLTIFGRDGEELLIYARGTETGLTGTTWEATSYNNGTGAVVSILTGTSITAVFDGQGSVAGNSGVNNYNAPCTIDGKSLTIGMPVSSMMAGTAEAMEQEALYLAALQTTATWQVKRGELALRTADGALVASYGAKKQ